MKRTPFPHQYLMADYAVNKGSGLLLAEPRTGKTLSSILALKKAGCRSFLIIVPPIGAPVWYDELEREGCDMDKVTVLNGGPAAYRKRLAKNSQIVISTYGIARANDLLHYRDFDGIILDEIHKLKDPTTKTSKYFLWNADHRLGQQFRLGLTGTPASETALNLVPMHIFTFGHFMGFTDFPTYYFKHWKYNQALNRDFPQKPGHLQEMMDYNAEHSFCITMKDLNMGGEVLQRTIKVDITSRQKSELRKLDKAKEAIDDETGIKKTLDMLGRNIKERKIASGFSMEGWSVTSTAKIQYVVDDLVENPRPLVVTGYFIEQVEEMFRALRVMNFTCRKVTGKTRTFERDKAIKDFQTGEALVLVAQSKTIQEAVDLSIADEMIILSESVSTETRIQLEKRLVNLNKTVPVMITSLACKDTVDVKLVPYMQSKKKKANSFIEDYYLYKK